MNHLLRIIALGVMLSLSAQAFQLKYGRYPDYPTGWWGDRGSENAWIVAHIVCDPTLDDGYYVIHDSGGFEIAHFTLTGGVVSGVNDPGFYYWSDVATPKSIAAASIQNHAELYAWGGFYGEGIIVDADVTPAVHTIDVTYYVSGSPPPGSPPAEPGATKPTDPLLGGNVASQATENDPAPGCVGMLHYSVHSQLVSLHLTDTPLTYAPAFGPPVNFTVSYGQLDVQPAVPDTQATDGFTNFGPQWRFNWLSYVTDDPTNPAEIEVYVRGGGTETYANYNAGTLSYDRDRQSQALLIRTTADSYEKQFPDGYRYLFTQSDGSTAHPRRIFLTKVIDPVGNEVNLGYNGFNRLETITDATGKVTTLHYDLAPDWYYRVTSVTDPFGRSAQFEYYADGRLWKITDAIDLTSEVAYEGVGNNFIDTLTTPYGVTHFAHGESGTRRWIEITDPSNGTERIEHRDYAPGIADSDSAPAGFFHTELQLRNTFYWDKKALAIAPGDYTKAHITHWLKSADGTATTSIVESEKPALESRIYYAYDGQMAGNLAGTSGRPTEVARLLDDASTQLFQFTYNGLGNLTGKVDPVGRSTAYSYHANDIDLFEVRQTTGAIDELLQRMENYVGHRPQLITDASGQETQIAYNARGQVTTVQNAKGEVTEFAYDNTAPVPTPNPRYGSLLTVTRAVGTTLEATVTYGYDSYVRVQSITDESEAYTLAFTYDAIGSNPLKSLDRVAKIAHPDGTFERIDYNRLDAEDSYDRLGRKTHTVHDELQRVKSVTDPENRTVQFEWCVCGALDKIIDANGQQTQWLRDLRKRPEYKLIAGVPISRFTYENNTSRLKENFDATSQRHQYTYYADDKLHTVTYADAQNPTSNVTYTYDSDYDRLHSIADDTGTVTYGYNPITDPPAGLGAGLLASVTGPSGNQAPGYTLSYTYDELGRKLSRSADGANNAVSWTFDALGRLKLMNNALGQFERFYVGTTNRVDYITYPNGQKTDFGYEADPLKDRLLVEIKNSTSTNALISQFNYGYAATGRIDTWLQNHPGLTNPKKYLFGYDGTDQLRSARLTDSVTGDTEKLYSYGYDPAGNRTVEQNDDHVFTTSYPDVFQMIRNAGGSMLFQGVLNGNATVSIGGNAAAVSPNPGGGPTQPYRFEGWANVAAGANSIAITATEADPAPGLAAQVTSRHIAVSITDPGEDITGSDNMGNNSSDWLSNYFGWDAENRLLSIETPTATTAITYDGLGRRVKMVTGATERHYVWDGLALLEERDGSNNVLKRYFPEGMSTGGNSYFYTRDHLGSVREVTDDSEVMRARYDYDPWGRRSDNAITLNPVESDFAFTGHFYHTPSNLHLAPFRAYSPDRARWLSRDPIGEQGGFNLYRYAGNSPVDRIDPTGLEWYMPGDDDYILDFDHAARSWLSRWYHTSMSHADEKALTVINAQCTYDNSPMRGFAIGVRGRTPIGNGYDDKVGFGGTASLTWTMDSGFTGSGGTGLNLQGSSASGTYNVYGYAYNEESGGSFARGLSLSSGAARASGGLAYGVFSPNVTLGFNFGNFGYAGVVVDTSKLSKWKPW